MSFANSSAAGDARESTGSDDVPSRVEEAAGVPRRHFRVAFDLPDGTSRWEPASVERMWAAKTDEKMVLRIQNVPFYTSGVAFGDHVRIRIDHDRRELVFDGTVVARSGHSTVRLIVEGNDTVDAVDGLLLRHNCPWEIDSTGLLWAVDVTVSTDYSALRSELASLADQIGIGIQEAWISDAHRAQLGNRSGSHGQA